MSKGGGKGHTPREAKDDLKSTQQLSVIDALSEGPIVGPVNGLQSVLINNTPVVDADGNSNIHGVTVVYQVGETPQAPLEGFEASGAETVLGVEVKHDNPVSATYQIGKTITVMANCERNGGSGAITVTININGQVKTAEVIPYTAGLPAMYQTVVFSVYTTSPVVDISVSLRVRGQYTTSASVWPLVMVSRSGSNFTN
ncbi:hypothetical protein LZ55_09015 [Salmonella enterica]|nr:hypothetical protein [Salmonella enterica]EBA3097732.1 hypothetical protein [Salmonella enterica]EBP1705832.1 hypothetical protein [Salmonella enterica]ECI8073106.1 hypothetical protein [Salmonella enterica subsp. enterica]